MSQSVCDVRDEIRVIGTTVSKGIALGRLFVLQEQEEKIPEFRISHAEEEEHIARFHKAISHSRKDLEHLQEQLSLKGHEEAALIIHAHIEMLEDPLIQERVCDGVRSTKKNIETVFRGVIHDIENTMLRSASLFFQERAVDVKDLSQRVMRHLQKKPQGTIESIPDGSILVVRELLPSHIATFEAGKVVGVLAATGGGSCHGALIARSKGIPFLSSIPEKIITNLESGDFVILDALRQELVLNPTEDTIRNYQKISWPGFPRIIKKRKKKGLPTATMDGVIISVNANICEISELEQFSLFDPDGIGLFRSEFLFLANRDYLQSENAQYEFYLSLLKGSLGKSVTVRVMDVGGDKDPAIFLGMQGIPKSLRGIRFLLHYKKLFLIQLRALLRAACHGELRVLLPFVCDLQEVLQTKELIEIAKNQLNSKRKDYKEVSIGVMIETPCSVMVSDLLAKECDFFSIGTNDLTQFTTGIDRAENGKGFSLPLGLIRMLQHTLKTAEECHLPLSLCGEMASDPTILAFLIGLGIRDFSCSLRFVPKVKETALKLQYQSCKEFADQVLSLRTLEEIETAFLKAKRQSLTF